jgi:hypothetical protein
MMDNKWLSSMMDNKWLSSMMDNKWLSSMMDKCNVRIECRTKASEVCTETVSQTQLHTDFSRPMFPPAKPQAHDKESALTTAIMQYATLMTAPSSDTMLSSLKLGSCSRTAAV